MVVDIHSNRFDIHICIYDLTFLSPTLGIVANNMVHDVNKGRTSLAPSKSVLLWNCGTTSDKRNHRPPWNSDNFESPIGLYQTVSEGHWMLSNSGRHVASARKHSIPVFVARDRAIYKLPAVWCGLKQSGPPGGNECVFHSVHTVDTDLWGANAKLSGLLNLEVRAGQKELNGIEIFNVC